MNLTAGQIAKVWLRSAWFRSRVTCLHLLGFAVWHSVDAFLVTKIQIIYFKDIFRFVHLA